MKNFWRVVLGTVVYVIIIIIAAPFPSAAGLMLIFPALNGLALLDTEASSVPETTKGMLWMPVLNGILCAFYIFTFPVLAGTMSTILLGWILFAVVVSLWLVVVMHNRTRSGIPSELQLPYAFALTLAGAILCIFSRSPFGTSLKKDSSLSDFVWSALSANWYKVGLFAIAFAGFLWLSKRLTLADADRGILSGLPLVPFGGLASIAVQHGLNIDERIATLKGMANGIWLGPAVAVWFILLTSAYLSRRKPSRSVRTEYFVRLTVVIAGWIACGGVIAAIVHALRLLA